MAITHDKISIRSFLEAGHPFQLDIRTRHLALDFPDHFLFRGDLEHAVAAAGGDQGVAVL